MFELNPSISYITFLVGLLEHPDLNVSTQFLEIDIWISLKTNRLFPDINLLVLCKFQSWNEVALFRSNPYGWQELKAIHWKIVVLITKVIRQELWCVSVILLVKHSLYFKWYECRNQHHHNDTQSKPQQWAPVLFPPCCKEAHWNSEHIILT